MRCRTSILHVKLENERLFLFGYCFRVGNMLFSWAYVCTHILFLKLQRFLKITEVSGHWSFPVTKPARKKLFFPGHIENMRITGSVSLFFLTYWSKLVVFSLYYPEWQMCLTLTYSMSANFKN